MDKLIVANQKNYMNVKEVGLFLDKIKDKSLSKNVVICPSSIYLPYFLKKDFSVGLQNIYLSDITCTGEITSKQAKNIGVSYVIIGHSERRNNMDEDKLVHKKILDAIHYGLNVIYCVGENISDRKHHKAKKVVKKQLDELKEINDLSNVIIAYEPVWAIGTGVTPTNKDIEDMINFIRSTMNKSYLVEDTKVLYGGSVKKENIGNLNEIDNLSGFLIGKASTDADELISMLEVVSN